MRKSTQYLIIVFLGLILLPGCWDRREPQEIAHGLLLGLDIDERGFYEAIVQYSNPSVSVGQDGGGGGGGGGASGGAAKRPFWTSSTKGHTPFEAVRNLALTTTRTTMLTHVQVLLVSEGLARHGIGPVIDLFARDRELRLTVQAAVVDGDIQKVMKADFPIEATPSSALDRLLRLTKSERGVTAGGPFLRKIIEFSRPGEEMTLSKIQVLQSKSKGGGGSASGASTMGSDKSPVKISGGAAFREDKMVGWLDNREMKGWNWIRGTVLRGPIMVSSPTGDGFVNIDVLKATSVIEPVIEGVNIKIRVTVNSLGAIGNLTNSKGGFLALDMHDPRVILSLRRRYSEVIRNDIEMAIKRAKELGTDIFGFGNLVYRKRPDIWKKFAKDRWEETFKTLPVEVIVKTEVRRPGLAISLTSMKHE
jgi:spore germination protein KC